MQNSSTALISLHLPVFVPNALAPSYSSNTIKLFFIKNQKQIGSLQSIKEMGNILYSGIVLLNIEIMCKLFVQ